uniref:Pullulanase 1ic isoform X2 n=1 Tax=Rhizophora mucronata TaxID=61149 RepID=A0A2P2M5R4_RHIMU
MRIHSVWILLRLCSSKRLTEFGVLKDQKTGRVVIMSMKYQSIIIARYALRNALSMIHMLEGMLFVSVCQRFS